VRSLAVCLCSLMRCS